jgi:hypothetical protein
MIRAAGLARMAGERKSTEIFIHRKDAKAIQKGFCIKAFLCVFAVKIGFKTEPRAWARVE